MVTLKGLSLLLCFVASSAEVNQPWWRTAVLYQIYPRSFKDSDGDGIGDLKGIIEKAEYLKDIGVNAIWLSPINPSPNADFGYDISDLTGIHPTFGTMADFDHLLKKLKKLDLQLVLDFIPNHTSDEHPWFKKSINNDTDYRDFYVWKNAKYDKDGNRKPPNNWLSSFGSSAWEWNAHRGQYYLHQFAKGQPDLNYRNPAVIGNMTAVLEFWLDKGIDGFRIDASAYIYEEETYPNEAKVPGTPGNTYISVEHKYNIHQPETKKLLDYWGDIIYKRVLRDSHARLMIVEILDDKISNQLAYYGVGKRGLRLPFNFGLVQGNQSVGPEYLKNVIDEWMKGMPKGGVAAWVASNHDQKRVPDTYGAEMVDAITLLTGVLPGIKVVYNGEEIGMSDTFIRWDQTLDVIGKNQGPKNYMDGSRDPERTPMQWDNTTSAGFSTSKKTWLPINPNYWQLNVEAQMKAEKSHLQVFKAVIKTRNDPVWRKGDLKVLALDNRTLVVIRSYKGSYLLLVINMSSEEQDYTSENLLSPKHLETDMTVIVASINTPYSAGQTFERGLKFKLIPKAAVLLRSQTAHPAAIHCKTSEEDDE